MSSSMSTSDEFEAPLTEKDYFQISLVASRYAGAQPRRGVAHWARALLVSFEGAPGRQGAKEPVC